ncbi:hypothetical protein [Burkholderia ambifaria]|uniref:hypothetical protein n=1 Tax=Burkholderia ambifaria TaxID=152480 RepID=UPI001589704C|nr:hypothetical protein [Burkholderia ambifaria]
MTGDDKWIATVGDNAWIAYEPGGRERSAICAMMRDDGGAFRMLYSQTWEPDNGLTSLAVEYHARCEAYDRLVCTGPIIDGAIMPIGARERSLISANARRVRRELEWRAERQGHAPRAFALALRRVGQWWHPDAST